MPAQVVDHAAETVMLTEEPFVLPDEGVLADAQASAQLAVLFNSYQSLKKSAPRLPGEKVAVPMAYFRPAEVEAAINKTIESYHAWLTKLMACVETIENIGETNPGASFALIGKSGRVLQVNGGRLSEAILRTEAEILGGQIRG